MPEEAPTKGDFIGAATQGPTRIFANISNKTGPWLRLVWIRAVAALAVLVAAILLTLALWMEGRRRAYVLLATGVMPSNGQRMVWLGGSSAAAVVAGVLIGAPVTFAAAPWIALFEIGSLMALCKVRAYKPARLL